jgi:hypothetical protein
MLAVLTGPPALGVTVMLLEAGPVPTELVAVTEQLYVVPLVSPVTEIGLALPVIANEPAAVQVAV